MRFQTSDPDIETIVRRINRKIIDLQPDFQRGEVWSTAKKQRLIDTILRKWHVPPIHLVSKLDGTFDVLDGQQRLTAIRDFVDGAFPVNGTIEPANELISDLGGTRYARLPDGIKSQFDAFPIRVFELYDYEPDEPHELFFRLNQPISLTEAEKRNAFIGRPRNQVKELVKWAEGAGMSMERLGFSNARMSYDDLIARFLLTLEQRTLAEKVTAFRITSRYRDTEPFPDDVLGVAQTSLQFFLGLRLLDERDARRKPNKATIHTWLCMAAKLIHEDMFPEHASRLGETIISVESGRLHRTHRDTRTAWTMNIFNDRATARVADVASVILRDICGWMLYAESGPQDILDPPFLGVAQNAWEILESTMGSDPALFRFATDNSWGGYNWL